MEIIFCDSYSWVGLYLGRLFFTGPIKRKYNIDAHEVMAREHINDAPRVINFLDLISPQLKELWPIAIPLLSINAMIYGHCKNDKGEH